MLSLLCLGAAPGQRLQDAPRPRAEDKVRDRFTPAPLDRQQIGGLLGERLRIGLDALLVRLNEPALLEPFQQRPGSGPRVGEHAGKLLDAGSAVWAYSGDERLKAALDRVAAALIAAQGPDGYLGAYPEDRRWTGWDVWVQQEGLRGLLSYYRVTGHPPALEAARKAGDLLTRTFGPGQRDILRAGPHLGMAATSLLGPACQLYRYTGEERRLADYVLRAYEQPGGPRLLQSLLRPTGVFRTADAHAPSILANLLGLVELHRLSGEPAWLKAALAAWNDIVARRRYITGTTSAGEYFKDDLNLPGQESARVGEMCATVGWLELNWQLLRLTGEAPYGDEIERTVYNHLLGAQDPRDGGICPAPPLVGRKRMERGLTCCATSHPRGMALLSQAAWGALEGGLALVLYAPGDLTIPLATPGGEIELAVNSKTRFPLDGTVTLTLQPARRASFPVFLRVPAWCRRFSATVAGAATPGQPGRFLRLDRTWQAGDRIQIDMDLSVQVIGGGASYPDHVALQRGPQVLALEASLNSEVPFLHRAAPANPAGDQLVDASTRLPKTWTGAQAYALEGIATQRTAQGRQSVGKRELLLAPFADARTYRVWLVKPDKMPFGPVPLTAFGAESWSRAGNVDGSICDERPDTFRVTFEGGPARQDWYAVETDSPEVITRVLYRHGKVFQNGGWFDTQQGKPAIQIRRTRAGNWETVAVLDSYPATTSKDVPNLHDGQPFEVRFKEPVKAVAVRILGRPGASFSSCAELAAYGP